MAEISRRPYYADPATGKRVRKSFPGAVRKRSMTWTIRYWTPDGRQLTKKGYRDKRATEALAHELEKRAQRVDGGFADALDAHAARPLAEHAEDFRRALTAKGNRPAYVDMVLSRLTAVLDGCRFVRMADVQSSAVLDFAADLRRDKPDAEGVSLKTANDYMDAAKGFTRWLWRDRRTPVDPLAGLSRLTVKGAEDEPRHARRDFTADELQRLLDAARRSAQSLRRLSGPDRYFLYLAACATGLRASELASVSPESFDLASEAPTLTVLSSCTKNKLQAEQPLPRDVADAFRGYLQDKPAGVPVWPGKWRSRAFLLIQADLAEARATWLSEAQNEREREQRSRSDFLAYCDADGRYIDFHALRHTYVTRLVQSGASPKTAQTLARHSTVQLTLGRYSHTGMFDKTAAVDALPSLLPNGPNAAAMAATGTDGPKFALPNLRPRPAISGDFERQTETERSPAGAMQKPAEKRVFCGFPGFRRITRKVAATGFEPVTSRL